MAWRWPLKSGWSLPRLFPRGRRRSAETPIVDPWASAPEASERIESPISQLLSEVEAAACAVYARHGLPDQPGHYAHARSSEAWRFLSHELTAEERWALVTAQRPGSGWRFGTLEDLGDQDDSPPEVRRAARMLRNCRKLRMRLAEGGSPSLGDELEAAIRLGSEWRGLDASNRPVAPNADPLRLMLPKKTRSPRKPRAKPTS